MLKKLIVPSLVIALFGVAMAVAVAEKSPSATPTSKITAEAAVRVDRAVARLQVIQKNMAETARALNEISQAASQPLVDEINELGQGKFTADEVIAGKVRVNAKTGELTRAPEPPPTPPAAPPSTPPRGKP